jgi:regulator of sirC expression with transglutaminase-like and TPR domain
MSFDLHYECDDEFLKLLARRRDVDLTVVALELARDTYPGLDFRETLDWISARVEELAGAVARAKSDADVLRELSDCIAETHGIFGEPECYEQADSNYLNRVIETRRGIPICLSILYMAVADKLGIELEGVSTPMHFLTRYESVDGPLFVDAFNRGRVLKPAECIEWLRSITRLPKPRIKRALQPVGPRTIVIRMLNNLKALHARQENWPAAWLVQHRLTALEPSAYQERRDLALISVRANQPSHAVELLESCLKTCPDDEREVLTFHLSEARHQLARWN